MEYLLDSDKHASFREKNSSGNVIALSEQEWQDLLLNLSQDLREQDRSAPPGKISALHENDELIYIVNVLKQENNRMKVAQVTWQKKLFDYWWQEMQASISTDIVAYEYKYKLPEIHDYACEDNTWETIGIQPRMRHSAVWTGTEMIIWGGWGREICCLVPLVTGGRYNPATDFWQPISHLNAPAMREDYSPIWTGTEMIIWGGFYPNDTLDTRRKIQSFDRRLDINLAFQCPLKKDGTYFNMNGVGDG